MLINQIVSTDVHPQDVFGALVKDTKLTVGAYHGDYYYNALWLDTNLHQTAVFYFGARSTGTHIGTDKSLICQYNERVYRLTKQAPINDWQRPQIEIQRIK